MKRLLAALVAILVTTACVPNETKSLISASPEITDACSQLTTATSVHILLPAGTVPLHQNAWIISDPAAVAQIVNFAEMRKNVGPIPFDVDPYPTVTATFYSGGRNVGIFGSGKGTFYLQCRTARGSRYASAQEMAEFQALIARPNPAQ